MLLLLIHVLIKRIKGLFLERQLFPLKRDLRTLNNTFGTGCEVALQMLLHIMADGTCAAWENRTAELESQGGRVRTRLEKSKEICGGKPIQLVLGAEACHLPTVRTTVDITEWGGDIFPFLLGGARLILSS